MHTNTVLLCVLVFIFLNHGVSGQFPMECQHNITHRIGVCCPVPNGHIKPCGWPERGRCQYYPDVRVHYHPSPPKNLDNDRMNWPHTYVRKGCVCIGNFYGPDCGKCKFGWEGEKCERRERVFTRRDIFTYTDDERRIFRETLQRGKVTPSGLGAVVPPKHPRAGRIRMVELSILEMFVYIHYRTSHHPVEECVTHYSYNWAHSGPQFPLWHRRFILWVERELRHVSEDPDFTIPYWDWIGAERCEVCRNDMVGAVNMAGGGELGRLDAGSPFAHWRTLCHRRENKTLEECGTCDPTADAGPIDRVKKSRWPKVKDVISMFKHRTYDRPNSNKHSATKSSHSFRSELEKVHGIGHTKGFAGTMKELLSAPNDPSFMLHHSFVDKLVEVWFHKLKSAPAHQYPVAYRRLGELAGEPMIPVYPPDYAISYFNISTNYGYQYDTFCLSYEDEGDCSKPKKEDTTNPTSDMMTSEIDAEGAHFSTSSMTNASTSSPLSSVATPSASTLAVSSIADTSKSAATKATHIATPLLASSSAESTTTPSPTTHAATTTNSPPTRSTRTTTTFKSPTTKNIITALRPKSEKSSEVPGSLAGVSHFTSYFQAAKNSVSSIKPTQDSSTNERKANALTPTVMAVYISVALLVIQFTIAALTAVGKWYFKTRGSESEGKNRSKSIGDGVRYSLLADSD